MQNILQANMQDWRYPLSVAHNYKRVVDPNHAHNFLQIFHINSGECEQCVGTYSTTLRPNAVSILPDNTPHYTDARYADNDLYFLNLANRYFNYANDNPYNFLNMCILPLCRTVRKKSPIFYPCEQTSSELMRLFHELHVILTNFRREQDMLVRGKMIELLALIAGEYASLEGQLYGSNMADRCPSVYMMLNYTHDSYTNPNLTADLVAREAMLSLRSFHRIFREVIGIPFAQYVQYLRLSHAKNLLNETDDIISSVAFSSGFSDVASFHRSFRKVIGSTPREYRIFTQWRLCTYPQQIVV